MVASFLEIVLECSVKSNFEMFPRYLFRKKMPQKNFPSCCILGSEGGASGKESKNLMGPELNRRRSFQVG